MVLKTVITNLVLVQVGTERPERKSNGVFMNLPATNETFVTFNAVDEKIAAENDISSRKKRKEVILRHLHI